MPRAHLCASPVTFQQFPRVSVDGTGSLQALAYLPADPDQVFAILEGLSDAELDRQPTGRWLGHPHVILTCATAQLLVGLPHPVDACEDKSQLEAKAVFEWATQEGERPITVAEMFDRYRNSRRKHPTNLDRHPLQDWCVRAATRNSRGYYLAAASYFAMHEVTHLPQLED